jgi:hypothetical protein
VTIKVSRELIGRLLGYVILVGLAVGFSAGIVSWVVWDIDPRDWSPTARAWHAALAIILLVLRWLYGVIEVSDEE